MFSGPIYTIGHVVKPIFNKSKGSIKTILYLAADNELNRKGIILFLEKCLPILMYEFGDLRICIGGTICNHLSKYYANKRNINLLYQIDNLPEFYSRGKIVINPMPSGTGLKIKTIEALAYHKYVVSTDSGFEGLEGYKISTMATEKNIGQFTNKISHLLTDSATRARYDAALIEFNIEWNKSVKKSMSQLINNI